MTVNGNNITGVVALGIARQTAESALVAGATTDNISEGVNNLYFTTPRARNVISANAPITYSTTTGVIDLDTTWDDLRAPATSINPTGLATPPMVDNEDGSLLFSTNDTVAIWFQMPHTWKEGTNIIPHIHWSKTTTNAGLPNWQMKYKWANAGDVFPAFNTLMSGTEGVPNSNIIDKHSIYTFGEISGAGKLISSMICIYLVRTTTGDTYADDARLMEVDIHYQVDSTGSRQEFIK